MMLLQSMRIGMVKWSRGKRTWCASDNELRPIFPRPSPMHHPRLPAIRRGTLRLRQNVSNAWYRKREILPNLTLTSSPASSPHLPNCLGENSLHNYTFANSPFSRSDPHAKHHRGNKKMSDNRCCTSTPEYRGTCTNDRLTKPHDRYSNHLVPLSPLHLGSEPAS